MLCFFQWFVCRVSRKVGLLKRRVRRYRCSAEKSKIARPCGEKRICKWKCTKHVGFGALFEVRMSKNCSPLWRKAHLQVKTYKTCPVRSTFWSSDVEKLHAAVARSTFASENVQNMSGSEHFLKFWCRKITRRCSAKHICKWTCTKHVGFGALFEVRMSKQCSPLRRKAHLQVKTYKTCGFRSTFSSSDVEKLVS